MLFVAKSRSVRGGMMIVFRTLPRFWDCLVLLGLWVFFFASAGIVLFQNTDEGDRYFSSFGDAANSMLVLLTTANYPDVMMPAYDQNRLSCVFFIVYLVVGLFLMLNLVLATICDSFQDLLARREASQIRASI